MSDLIYSDILIKYMHAQASNNIMKTFYRYQGTKKVTFRACYSGKLKVA